VEQKKRSVGASERDEFLRAAWRSLVFEEIQAHRLVFVDEMGANISLVCVVETRRASVCERAAQLGEAHNALGEYELRGDGRVLGCRRLDHHCGL
jgi:hypothetical protein